MKIIVRLSSWEIQNILREHLEKKFAHHVNKGDILEIKRVGEPPPDYEVSVESVRPPSNAWD